MKLRKEESYVDSRLFGNRKYYYATTVDAKNVRHVALAVAKRGVNPKVTPAGNDKYKIWTDREVNINIKNPAATMTTVSKIRKPVESYVDCPLCGQSLESTGRSRTDVLHDHIQRHHSYHTGDSLYITDYHRPEDWSDVKWIHETDLPDFGESEYEDNPKSDSVYLVKIQEPNGNKGDFFSVWVRAKSLKEARANAIIRCLQSYPDERGFKVYGVPKKVKSEYAVDNPIVRGKAKESLSQHDLNMALEMRDRYHDDLEAGHTGATEYWRGQAAAYFTGNPIHLPPKVGDIVQYQSLYSIRKVKITNIESDIKDGRPGFEGIIVSGPEKGAEVWGYLDYIIRNPKEKAKISQKAKNNFEKLKKIVKERSASYLSVEENKKVLVDVLTATMLLKVYGALSPQFQEHFISMLGNQKGLIRLSDFGWKHVSNPTKYLSMRSAICPKGHIMVKEGHGYYCPTCRKTYKLYEARQSAYKGNPAVSEKQSNLFGIALAIKRGNIKPSYSPEAAKIADSMSEQQIKEFLKEDWMPETTPLRNTVIKPPQGYAYFDVRNRQADAYKLAEIVEKMYGYEALVQKGRRQWHVFIKRTNNPIDHYEIGPDGEPYLPTPPNPINHYEIGPDGEPFLPEQNPILETIAGGIVSGIGLGVGFKAADVAWNKSAKLLNGKKKNPRKRSRRKKD